MGLQCLLKALPRADSARSALSRGHQDRGGRVIPGWLVALGVVVAVLVGLGLYWLLDRLSEL